MKILVWCSAVSIGGGGRLLANLLPAMAELEEVARIHLVIHSMSQLKERMALSPQSKLTISYSDNQEVVPLQHLAEAFDLVYCFWPHGMVYEPAGKPMICTFHDTTVFDFVPPFLSGAILKHAWAQAKDWLENCSAVVVPSRYIKSRLIANFGKKHENAAVISHAISPATVFTAETLSPGVAKKLPPEYILYPSNTAPHKNHYNLLLAYAKFARRKQYPLVLCGYQTEDLTLEPPDWPDKIYLPVLVSLIKRSGLQLGADLVPLGYVSDNDVNLLIRNAKALIMPSLAEGGGSYPVEEALSMGTPVLCSDIPVMREHLAARSAKIVWFDPESPVLIAAALEEMLLNYHTYKNSVMLGSNDARPCWRDIAEQYVQVFRSILLPNRQ
ncbi:glycosyl transferases group 1 [Lucifera butyrica]|uniref:Glycosyl transferases group 1 n=1 Tax=Lucifera butyrica TaxID=1351585 RepID=A0A498REM1_9FIRM|nr:glycosyltransferase family 1 protein [Lucifera butyrica]VBB08533.1 glycosyl transferases group 1 [Lucifera butyrica]